MKQIGIKLADGSFYPIMEEGQPVKKTLGLTTVNDNQTRVLVDVYRSKTGTMEDAEYVDSLQIDNLVAHPNGTVDINLNIGLDEDNKLHAEMIDPETGASSNANVTLVSRTLEERLEPTNYDVKLGEDGPEPVDSAEGDSLVGDDFALPDFGEENTDEISLDSELDAGTENVTAEETAETEDNNGSFAAGAIAGAAVGGLAAAAIMSNKDDEAAADSADFESTPETADSAESFDIPETTDATEGDSSIAEEFDLPDFGEENPLEESVTEEAASDSDDAASLANDEFDLPDFGEEAAEEEISVPVTDETVADESPAEPSADETSAEAPTEDFSFDETPAEEPAAEDNTFAADDSTVAADDTSFSTDDLDLPDFSEEPAESPAEESTTEAAAEDFSFEETPAEETAAAGDETIADTSDDAFGDLDLPDFDTDSESGNEPDNSSEDTSIDDNDAFFDSIKTEETEAETDNSDLVKDNTPSNGINFSGLYDEETVAGGASRTEDDEDDVRKKTRVPVIICVVCAIICILATLLVLFIVPSKYNLLHKTTKEEAVTVEKPVEKQEPPAEEKPVQAKENEIVVAKEPELVVPETPKEPVNKPKDIRYKIKWGDTLWDIADAYYKNPWNYKKIARYNNIKNPDHIISGTYITIPAN